MSEADAADEVIETASRTAMTGAAQVGQGIARARQRRAEQARHENAADAREYEQRFNAERELAAKWLERTRRDEWWSRAEPRDAVQAYEVATAWEGQGEAFGADAARRIEYQTQQRWETPVVDVQREQYESSWKHARDLEQAKVWALENRPELMAEGERLTVADELLTEAQRQEAAAARERVDADILAAWGDRHLSDARQAEGADQESDLDQNQVADEHRDMATTDLDEAESKWDSTDRREAYAEQLREASDVDQKTADANIANDRNNAKSPAEAAGAQRRSYGKPKGRRRAKGRTQDKQLNR